MIQKTKTIYRLLGMAIMKKEVETSVDETLFTAMLHNALKKPIPGNLKVDGHIEAGGSMFCWEKRHDLNRSSKESNIVD